MSELLRDAKGKIMGRTQVQGNKTILFDPTGKQLGYYDKSTNSTFTAQGKIVARMNVLLSLIGSK